jgi:hypothetical protein
VALVVAAGLWLVSSTRGVQRSASVRALPTASAPVGATPATALPTWPLARRLAHDTTSESPSELDQADELRDSEAELRQLEDYANGLEHVAPLREEQKRALLSAKLRRKREFESAVREAVLDGVEVSGDEQMRAQVIVEQALERYRDDFLLDASEILDEEQLVYLSNYETTEFERAAAELQQIATNGQ